MVLKQGAPSPNCNFPKYLYAEYLEVEPFFVRLKQSEKFPCKRTGQKHTIKHMANN